MKTFAVLYSYPTWDPHYRGQRGVRVEARDEKEALLKIQTGIAPYGPVPDARLVHIKERERQ